jgi:hypothetical protein
MTKPKNRHRHSTSSTRKRTEKPTPMEKALLSPPSPPIEKPAKPGFLDRYKSKRMPVLEVRGAVLNPLKVMKIPEVGDHTRLHPDEGKFWSEELCFVSVPVHGEKRDLLHLIDPEMALRYSLKVAFSRLALASKPNDILFLCVVPSQNLDNSYNASALRCCQRAKIEWGMAVSRRKKGYEDYEWIPARDQDAFADLKWSPHGIDEWCDVTFKGRDIFDNNHPGLLRLIGAKQKLD